MLMTGLKPGLTGLRKETKNKARQIRHPPLPSPRISARRILQINIGTPGIDGLVRTGIYNWETCEKVLMLRHR